MKLWIACALMFPVLSVLSCRSTQVLDVRPFHLREITTDDGQDPMIVGEQRRHLHGAIGVGEQAQKLGYYYTVHWNEDSGSGPGEVVFEFQQGSSGSRVKKMVHQIQAGETAGRAEFAVIGDDYLRDGKPDRVLAWRCKLIRDGREVASRRSYLWQ